MPRSPTTSRSVSPVLFEPRRFATNAPDRMLTLDSQSDVTISKCVSRQHIGKGPRLCSLRTCRGPRYIQEWWHARQVPSVQSFLSRVKVVELPEVSTGLA